MVEQQRFDGALQQVGNVIEAADMRQLMSQHSFQFLSAQIDQRAGGNQDHGPYPSNNGGHLSERGLTQPYASANPELSGERGQASLPDLGKRALAASLQSLRDKPTGGRPH